MKDYRTFEILTIPLPQIPQISHRKIPQKCLPAPLSFSNNSSIVKSAQDRHDPQHFCFASVKQGKVSAPWKIEEHTQINTSRRVNYSHLSLLKSILSLSCFSSICIVYIFIYLDEISGIGPKALTPRLSIMHWKKQDFLIATEIPFLYKTLFRKKSLLKDTNKMHYS